MQPNIIYILSDQHNSKVLGCSGDPYINTPHIDALAESGVTLRDCSCASPLCVPSRSALLSGLSPLKTGIYNNMQALPIEVPTFAHSLSNAGYETVLCGRMHFVGFDQCHGFQTRLVGDITETFPISGKRLSELEQDPAFHRKRPSVYGSLSGTSGQRKLAVTQSGGGDSAVLHFDREVTDAAVSYLHSRTETRPLLMTVGLYGPHCPYVAPPELFQKYDALLPEDSAMTPDQLSRLHPAMEQWIRNRGVASLTGVEIHQARAAYYAMVEYTDTLVGEILDAVFESLGRENTVVIYGSDHGDCIGAHGYFWKSNFFTESVRVPMIFSWKDVFPAGASLDAPTSLLDLAPTLTQLAQAEPLPDGDGRSLVEELHAGHSAQPDRKIYSFCSDTKGDSPSAMVKTRDYKLILYADHPPQLFCPAQDPREVRNLAGTPEVLEIERALTNDLLTRWNPEKARQDLEISKKRAEIVGCWFSDANYIAESDWSGNLSWNHIDYRTQQKENFSDIG